MARLQDKAVVITGAASGIGEATARAVVAEGGKLVIADVQQQAGEALANELGAAAVFQQTDVTREGDIEAAINCCCKEFGSLDGMVNNAGIVGGIGSIMETSAEAFDHTMAILSRAVFLGTKHAARAMKNQGSGSIVSLSSTAGVLGGLGPHVYSMAKHAVIGLTKSAASELAAHGIRVNAVAPGGTLTPMTKALGDNTDATTVAYIEEASPLGIACRAEDIATAIVYLLSEDARCVHGHTLVVDSGETAFRPPPPFHTEEAQVILHAGQRVEN